MIAVYLIDVAPWHLPSGGVRLESSEVREITWGEQTDAPPAPVGSIDAVEVAPYFADEVTL